MNEYFAPMEGITGYIYRNAFQKYGWKMEKYFSPFLAPKTNTKKCFNHREYEDIRPDHNEGLHLVPQILTNRAGDFLKLAEALEDLGYQEINLNLGCPSPTVVTKKKGAGFLGEPEKLREFLEEIFRGTSLDISVKTRIGLEDPEEFTKLLEIYNQYPLKELIIHPRIQKDFYKNTPRMEAFSYGLEHSRAKVCYNGNLFTKEDYQTFCGFYPACTHVMLGRGLLANPGLLQEVHNKTPMDRETFSCFHREIYENYQEVSCGERNVLFKMKELWFYFREMFPEGKKQIKRIKKAETLRKYEEAVNDLFQNVPLYYESQMTGKES